MRVWFGSVGNWLEGIGKDSGKKQIRALKRIRRKSDAQKIASTSVDYALKELV
jgi:hypothetical protein